MPRPKSLLQRVSIDVALKGHKCQHNKSHLIARGERRLKLTVGRSYQHYCIECALKIIESDIEKLASIRKQLLD